MLVGVAKLHAPWSIIVNLHAWVMIDGSLLIDWFTWCQFGVAFSQCLFSTTQTRNHVFLLRALRLNPGVPCAVPACHGAGCSSQVLGGRRALLKVTDVSVYFPNRLSTFFDKIDIEYIYNCICIYIYIYVHISDLRTVFKTFRAFLEHQAV